MFLSSRLAVNINAQFFHISQTNSPVCPDYQFFLMQDGNAQIVFNDTGEKYQLSEHDLIMIPPNINISCHASTANTLLSIRIDRNYLENLIPYRHQIKCNSTIENGVPGAYRELSDIIFQLCSAIFTQKSELLIESLIYRFAYQIQEYFIYPVQEKEKDWNNELPEKRIAQMKEYLQQHYQQDISLNSLAKTFFLSPQYLSKYFKKYTGYSFSSYLTNLRLEQAVLQLVSNKNTITDIALDNGFPSVASFIRTFRQKYLVSPNRYRQEYSAASSEPAPESTWQPTEKTDEFQNISIDAQHSKTYEKPWQMGINAGHFSNTLRNSFYASLQEYRRDLPIKYIRFTNILDPDVFPYDSTIDEYDFTNIDATFAFLKHNGIYPFIELSYKPPKGNRVILKQDGRDLFDNEKSLTYYCQALRALIRHSINSLGIEYVENWRFEVWYKYGEDLTPCETLAAYIERYRRYYQTICQLLPNSKIGGPGFNICGNKQDFVSLLSGLDEASLPMDYITFSAFPYHLRTVEELADPAEVSTRGFISPSPNHILNTFREYQDILCQSRNFSQIPPFITELCAVLTPEPYISSSLFSAAFLCKSMLDLSSCCKGIFYSYFIDAKKSSQNQYDLQTYIGLILENGIPKPSMHAYYFLSLLGEKLIDRGDGYIITSNSVNQYQLLCYNYTHFNRSFCFNSWDPMYADNTYSAFENGETRRLCFHCSSVPAGKYKVKQYLLNHGHGSILDKYIHILQRGNITREELGSIVSNLQEEERNYFKKTCFPLQEIYFMDVEEELSIKTSLTPHEICFYEFTKIK